MRYNIPYLATEVGFVWWSASISRRSTPSRLWDSVSL